LAQGEILNIDITEEMEQSYLDYAMSVIIGRALPDVRDGLKPVQRRILYAMYEMGNTSTKPFKKSARVVGDVIGKYHPHGDAAVYDALVRMAQDFSMRYPLVQGQGNFGSIDGDSPAAMRYTEVRMSRIAEELMADIEKDTVDFIPNYDGSLMEPLVLPTRIPNLLLNGTTGIAVAMSSNIPPHNLREVVDGTIAYIKNPDITIDELMNYIKGPDFPTYGIINGTAGIREAYKTGKGQIKIRARAKIERKKGEKVAIVITEVPFQVEKSKVLEHIAKLVQEKKLEGITDLRDESNREGIRVVIELKKGANPEVILNRIFKETAFETSFNIILTAIVYGRPKVLNLKEILQYFVEHRKEVIIRRTQFDLAKAEERAHILEGLKIAVENIDEVIALIKSSPNPGTAKERLIERFSLSEKQAQAILDMKLQRLTNLERDKIIKDYEETLKLIERLKYILDHEEEVKKIMIEELEEIKEKYGDDRRTEIMEEIKEIKLEDTIQDEPMVITITSKGYIKRTKLAHFRTYQNRGGKGIQGAGQKDGDFVTHLFVANALDYLLIFTNKGKVYWKKVYEIPEGSRTAQGKAIVNLIDLAPDEKIATILSTRDFDHDSFIIFATAKGYVKKTDLRYFSNPIKRGIRAITLEEGDNLFAAKLIKKNEKIFIGTRKGYSICFSSEEVRPMGREARGVRGISLRGDDEVINMVILREGATILSVSDRGYGKRTKVSEFRVQKRGGMGIIAMKLPGDSVAVGYLQVKDRDQIMIITSKGSIVRLNVSQIPIQGRSTRGVRLIKTDGDDMVTAIARVVGDEEEPSLNLFD